MRSLAELDERLSRPSPALVSDLDALDGDILVLGAGGKLGPSLVSLALRVVAGRKRVIAVSRFAGDEPARSLEAHGATILRADMTDESALAALPDVKNVVFLVGSKFGSTGREAETWYTNAYLPGRVADRFRASRIVALSTGNVYPFTPVGSGGPTETSPIGPVGEYAMSCLGRERVFSRFAKTYNTPLALIRLNYAVEMRYGVLVDLAQKVLAGRPIDLSMSAFNVIWQGDANAHTLAAFSRVATPPFVLNVTGPETLRVRAVCERFAELFRRPVTFTGVESPDALLNDAGLSHRLFGPPRVSAEQMIPWIADWLLRDQPTLNKPTHFEARDGKF